MVEACSGKFRAVNIPLVLPAKEFWSFITRPNKTELRNFSWLDFFLFTYY